MYRVVQWATGAMGRTALRRVIDHPDLELVGVFVHDPSKVGLDAGALARRPATGVMATGDVAAILALDADVVIHTPRITSPYEAQNADVIRLLASGKNVVSSAGFHWPASHGGAYTEPLLAAALAGGATLAGVGVNPGGIVERIALAATGFCATLDRIDVRETVDASGMTSAAFVFGLMGFGQDPAANDITRGPLAEMYRRLFGEVLFFSAHAMGKTIASVEPRHEVVLTPNDLTIAAGVIPAGRVAATRWCWLARFEGHGEMSLSVLWTADPSLHAGLTSGHWLIDIQGRPNIRLTLDIHEGDVAAPAARALTDATAAILIRAIPDVCAAAPGFFAYAPTAPFRDRLTVGAP